MLVWNSVFNTVLDEDSKNMEYTFGYYKFEIVTMNIIVSVFYSPIIKLVVPWTVDSTR